MQPEQAIVGSYLQKPNQIEPDSMKIQKKRLNCGKHGQPWKPVECLCCWCCWCYPTLAVQSWTMTGVTAGYRSPGVWGVAPLPSRPFLRLLGYNRWYIQQLAMGNGQRAIRNGPCAVGSWRWGHERHCVSTLHCPHWRARELWGYSGGAQVAPEDAQVVLR